MKAVNINRFCTSPARSKEWEQIPEIKEARPDARKNGYVEISLQRLDGFPKTVILVQWHGAKNGLWFAASDVFKISKSGKNY